MPESLHVPNVGHKAPIPLGARVGPAEKRKIVPGPDGVTVVALGGAPGHYEGRA